MYDRQNRKINYLRISITDRCNLRCTYCMPSDGISKKCHKEILRNEEVLKIVESSVDLGIEKVRITGGEPLIRKGIVELVRDIASFEQIKDLTLTTNGILLKRYAKDLAEAGLNRVNISIDTLNPEKYAEITRGGRIEDVLEGIREARKYGLSPIKINVVLIGGFNEDEIESLVELTRDEDTHVRFIELMPIGEASAWNIDHFISNDSVLDKVPELKPIQASDIGSPAKYYQLDGAVGTVGLINPISCNFCSDCNRIRITSDGKIKPCLHSDDEIDLLAELRQGMDIKETIKNAILNKPKEHLINDQEFEPITRNMNRIGG